MKKIYKSKVGLELVIPLVLIFGTIITLVISQKQSWLGFLIIIPTILLVVHLFMTTRYTIDGDELTIKSGFLYHKTIVIKAIKKIAEKNNLLNSPATSLDRLEINYEFGSVLISPKLKSQFIDEIKRLNPNVVIMYKKKKT